MKVYRSVAGAVDAWYASFRKGESQWKLDRVKGIERDRVEELMRPTSLTLADHVSKKWLRRARS